MARLTDAAVRNARVQALRAVRRAERKVDTKLEVLERRLDRAIENKERVTPVVADSIVNDFKGLVDFVRDLEKALSDMGVVFTSTSS